MNSTVKQYLAGRRGLPFWIALFALVVLAGASFGHVSGSPAEQSAPATATPTAPRAAVAAPGTFDPFPVTESMTETMLAVLRAYERAVDDQRILNEGPVQVENHWSEAYLPGVRAAVPPSPTPTTPPPTATSPAPTRTTAPTATRVPEPVTPADIAITIWPAPSIRVARNGTLTYEIRVKNYANGQAGGVQVTLPFSAQQLTVTGSQFSKAGDWVSELTTDRVVVSFGPVAPGEYRTAKIMFRASNTVADNAVIDLRASYTWNDDGAGGRGRSNWAPILGGSMNTSSEWVWLSVDPAGGNPGTTHRFFTDRFIPGEGIVTWLNTPNGVKPLELRGVADSMGRITLDFRGSGLTAGSHSLVLFGSRSNLTAIATFQVW